MRVSSLGLSLLVAAGCALSPDDDGPDQFEPSGEIQLVEDNDHLADVELVEG